MQKLDLIIENGTCVLPSQTDPEKLVLAQVSLGILAGEIVEIAQTISTPAEQRFDARGLHVLPGVIDSQVHFREPGLTHKEDIESGTRGAALGGVTAVYEMPNTNPSTLTKKDLEDKLNLAKGRTWCDHAFFMGSSAENADHLAELESLPGCVGVKIFMGSSTGSLLVWDDETLTRCLSSGKRRVAIHAEDEVRLKERKSILGEHPNVGQHHIWRDDQTAILATQRILAIARKTKRPIHVLHITTTEETELLAQAKDIATFEITPQHLFFSAPECYERLGTYAQMNPPIREERHRQGLWKAIVSGNATVIGTDHAPHTKEEKSKPYPQSPSGMTGVQTMVPVMLDFVSKQKLSLERLVELICRNPARIYGAKRRGEIKLGNLANFTIVDLNREQTITHSMIASKSAWTPYDNVKVKGWPIATIVRGHVVMRDGQTIGSPLGEPVVF